MDMRLFEGRPVSEWANDPRCIVGLTTVRYRLTNHHPGRLISFADRCVSGGDMYLKAGWTLDATLAPDYHYLVDKRRVHKFNYRKSRFERGPSLAMGRRSY